MGARGASGVLFKITCTAYGYIIVGKGTTTYLWPEVSREADVYCILQRVQASAVPVFLGTIDLAKIYFLHGAGKIRHMLLMAWGGESISKMEDGKIFNHEIKKSVKEIRSLGIRYQDLRSENTLWNAELQRVLIIDFHRSQLDPRLIKKRRRLPDIPNCGAERWRSKRRRASHELQENKGSEPLKQALPWSG